MAKLVQHVENRKLRKNFKKMLLKDYQCGILMGAEKNQYFMRRLRGKSPFVENCLQENIR